MERDRDERGRARNSRPRDELGRPLARGLPGIEPWDDTRELTPEESLAEAQRLLDSGLPFQAHEALEAAWKSAPPDERALWQGLAQLAVGVTHAARGNGAGARTLLLRARTALAGYPTDAPHRIDVEGLLAWIDGSLPLVIDGAGGLPTLRLII